MVWLIAEAPLEEEPAVMKRRASPQSPLDLCRSASASSAEKPEVAPRSLALADEACCIEVVAAPSIPASALIRRPAARKMTKLELQAMERTLFEERAKLRKVQELPILQDDGPATDFYGRFSNRERSYRDGGSGEQSQRVSRSWSGRKLCQ
ncbi:DEAD-box ATP-dependent RNA helicase 3, chloroplastic-like isoform X2 [Zingiber officinale]|uniref:DEAD-box ATP-dependent RNA helicase 3, chloroplastic-like isoform X2 n=1 Tax=Zingiber officinale TaxID=94328 RepID=UPI001C4B4F01|nr:DEAD-box ATP-dependent RNA helicase 3, chloroplastic-like isoform X2 [Zingiber officinale]